MAQRRMFSLKIIDTDAFLDMPPSTQSLYFHLAMRADDDGFVSSPRKIMKISNSSDDDYKLLLAKHFVIPFDSGICVIKHWKIHNYIQSDRYQQSMYHEERDLLTTSPDGSYDMDAECIQDASILDTQVRLGKVSIGKDSKKDTPPKKISHPTLQVPMNETRYNTLVSKHGKTLVDDYIERVKDWADSRGKVVKDYAAAAANWIKRDEKPKGNPNFVPWNRDGVYDE